MARSDVLRRCHLLHISSLPELIERKIAYEPNTGCWLWIAAINAYGYGVFNQERKARIASRVVYVLLVGPIGVGLQLDHLCRVRRCVNPSHLEPVTQVENIRRSTSGRWQLRKTHCPAGHPYAGDNLYLDPAHPGRGCKTCRTSKALARYWRIKQRASTSTDA